MPVSPSTMISSLVLQERRRRARPPSARRASGRAWRRGSRRCRRQARGRRPPTSRPPESGWGDVVADQDRSRRQGLPALRRTDCEAPGRGDRRGRWRERGNSRRRRRDSPTISADSASFQAAEASPPFRRIARGGVGERIVGQHGGLEFEDLAPRRPRSWRSSLPPARGRGRSPQRARPRPNRRRCARSCAAGAPNRNSGPRGEPRRRRPAADLKRRRHRRHPPDPASRRNPTRTSATRASTAWRGIAALGAEMQDRVLRRAGRP